MMYQSDTIVYLDITENQLRDMSFLEVKNILESNSIANDLLPRIKAVAIWYLAHYGQESAGGTFGTVIEWAYFFTPANRHTQQPQARAILDIAEQGIRGDKAVEKAREEIIGIIKRLSRQGTLAHLLRVAGDVDRKELGFNQGEVPTMRDWYCNMAVVRS